MSKFDELVGILKELLFNRFYPKPDYIRGLLGDGRGNVLVPGRVDYNYVRFSRASTETFEVFNKEVSQPVDGLPVLLGEYPWQPGLIQVVSVDWSAYAQTGWGDEWAGIQAHAPTHEWPNFTPGSDPLNVYLRAITPMRTQAAASGSTSVQVTAYEYDGATGTNYQWPGLPPLNLQSATPPTGSMRYMGVYLNPATNTLGVVTGATTIFTDALEPDRPAWPRGVYPSAYVRLYGGQSQIRERDIRDARRPWESTLIFTGTVGLPTPIITGSYLGSLAGTPTWTNVTQLAAPDGSPNPALYIDDAGDSRVINDVYIALDKAGVKQRTVDNFQASITDHFDGTFSGWTWATYTGFAAPNSASVVTTPSNLVIQDDTTTPRAFAYRGTFAPSGIIFCRAIAVLDVRTGLRMDDGTNSEYLEFFMEPNAGLIDLKHRYAIGGVVTGPTTVLSGLAASLYITLQMTKIGAANALRYGINGPTMTNVTSASIAGLATFTRSGIMHEHVTGATSTFRVSIFDWYKQ